MREVSLTVLVVDDDKVDVITTQRALRKMTPAPKVLVARDAHEALDILRGQGGQTIEQPFLVLLDLNMPRMDGFEFLEEIRSDPRQMDAVVFVHTTSPAAEDVARAYSRNVAGYLVKGTLGTGEKNLARLLQAYQDSVMLPRTA